MRCGTASPSPRSARRTSASPAPTWRTTRSSWCPATSTIKTKADLAGKVIGIQDGSSAIDAVQKDPIAASFKELKKFGDNVTALMDLTTGRLDAVVLDEVVGRYYTAKKPNDYVVLDDHFGTEEYGVGTRKDDTALLAKLQKAMDDDEGRRQRRPHLHRVVRQEHHQVSRPGGSRRPPCDRLRPLGAPDSGVARVATPTALGPHLPAARPASRHGLHPQHPRPARRGLAGHAAALPHHPAAGGAARARRWRWCASRASASPARRSTATSG